MEVGPTKFKLKLMNSSPNQIFHKIPHHHNFFIYSHKKVFFSASFDWNVPAKRKKIKSWISECGIIILSIYNGDQGGIYIHVPFHIEYSCKILSQEFNLAVIEY